MTIMVSMSGLDLSFMRDKPRGDKNLGDENVDAAIRAVRKQVKSQADAINKKSKGAK